MSSDEWEEVDVEDGDPEEQAIAAEKLEEKSGNSTESFSIVDTSSKEEKKDKSSFEVIGDSHSSIAGAEDDATNSIGSFIYKNSAALNKGKKGKGR